VPDWRNWPKADWKIADPKSLPDWARGPEVQKELRAEMLRALPIMLGAILVPFGVAFALFALYAPNGTGPIAAWIGLGCFASFLASMYSIGRWGEEWSGRRRRRRVLDLLESREEPVLGDEVVGVTYSDTLWRDSVHGDSWDWGALRLEMDRLSFVGRSSRFDLRPESIRSLEIKSVNHIAGIQGRLYVTWDDDAKTETLILELPYVRSRQRRIEAIDNLRERIGRWRREPLPSYDRTPLVAPLRQDEVRPEINAYAQIGRPAKLLAALIVGTAAVTVQISVLILLTLLGYRTPGAIMSGLFGGLFVVWLLVWLLIAAAVERRLPEKLRYPKKRVDEELPALNLGVPSSETQENPLEIRQ
jgi:hypothetical protein